MTKPRVVVLDYGSGNIRSAQKALAKAGAEVEISNDAQVVLNADGVIVPGVGAFHSCVTGVRSIGADRILEMRLVANRPVLGICVGMQMMFESGIEGGVETPGLGQWPGKVLKLQAKIVPHMGWNEINVGSGSRIFAGVESSRFYFVHSYAVDKFKIDETGRLNPPVVSTTTYESEFVSAVENGPLSAVQFHPEKSGDAGIHLLKNWIDLL